MKYLVFWIAVAAATGLLAWRKHRSVQVWTSLALGLNVLALGAIAYLPALPPRDARDFDPRLRKCPHCTAYVKAEASICRTCFHEVEPLDDIETRIERLQEPWRR